MNCNKELKSDEGGVVLRHAVQLDTEPSLPTKSRTVKITLTCNVMGHIILINKK